MPSSSVGGCVCVSDGDLSTLNNAGIACGLLFYSTCFKDLLRGDTTEVLFMKALVAADAADFTYDNELVWVWLLLWLRYWLVE